MTEDMAEMMKNSPADVVYNTYAKAFFHGMVKMFQQDNETRSIVMTDKTARDQATRLFFHMAQRQVREA
jgi:type I restriction enzyme R subunit